jgi:hypothetical protein
LALNHWVEAIEEHGSPYLTSAEANEEMHKTGAKEAYGASNKYNAEGQMFKFVLRKDAMSMLCQDDEVLRIHSSQKIPNRISKKAGPSGTFRSPMGFLNLDKMILPDYKYCKPGFHHLRNIVHCVAVHLGGHPLARQAGMPVRLPTPDSPKLEVYKVMTFDRPRRSDERILLRANLNFRGHRRLSNVSVKGNAAGEVFYAKIFMFFIVKFRDVNRKCAFIRWYQKLGRTNGPTKCPILRWHLMSNSERFSGPKVPFYDVIDVEDIIDIACIRSHTEAVPSASGDLFLVNIHAL